ncbi:hypothetical protein SDC9_211422 [bioreactor metagenome]|uniref:Uncharacterized protein n=1 Tax=bioreactor metagenome TaxID=1076179 RepID=A0A645JJW2_9ZZZZ
MAKSVFEPNHIAIVHAVESVSASICAAKRAASVGSAQRRRHFEARFAQRQGFQRF